MRQLTLKQKKTYIPPISFSFGNEKNIRINFKNCEKLMK